MKQGAGVRAVPACAFNQGKQMVPFTEEEQREGGGLKGKLVGPILKVLGLWAYEPIDEDW